MSQGGACCDRYSAMLRAVTNHNRSHHREGGQGHQSVCSMQVSALVEVALAPETCDPIGGLVFQAQGIRSSVDAHCGPEPALLGLCAGHTALLGLWPGHTASFSLEAPLPAAPSVLQSMQPPACHAAVAWQVLCYNSLAGQVLGAGTLPCVVRWSEQGTVEHILRVCSISA